jgi:uncharacterized membrane protein YiaA
MLSPAMLLAVALFVIGFANAAIVGFLMGIYPM